MPKWSAVRKNIFSGYKTATGEVIEDIRNSNP